jgi:hypothetical protein
VLGNLAERVDTTVRVYLEVPPAAQQLPGALGAYHRAEIQKR